MLELAVAAVAGVVALLEVRNARWRRRQQRFILREEIDHYLQLRLMQLLPLPHLGDRESLLKVVERIAPGRPMAICSVADPPLVLILRAGESALHLDVAASVETHRVDLAAGRIVQDDDYGTLVPARTQAGDLRAALVVDGTQPVTLDEHGEGALRYLASLVEYPLAMNVWPYRLRPERDAFSATSEP
jgi:hypothetical protein